MRTGEDARANCLLSQSDTRAIEVLGLNKPTDKPDISGISSRALVSGGSRIHTYLLFCMVRLPTIVTWGLCLGQLFGILCGITVFCSASSLKYNNEC